MICRIAIKNRNSKRRGIHQGDFQDRILSIKILAVTLFTIPNR